MNGMGCTGEAGQTSKEGQFLRLCHSMWKKLYIQSLELLETVQFSQKWSGEVQGEVSKMSLAE